MRRFGYTCALFVLLATPTFAREWIDNTSKHHLEAEFVRLDASKVYLRTPEGGMRSCKWSRLSAGDQQFVELLLARQRASEDHKEARSAQPARTQAAPARSLAEEVRPASVVVKPAATVSSVTVQSAAQAGAPSYTYKRIFSGYHSTFQLYGGHGTGAFWYRNPSGVRHHYLATLKHHSTLGNFQVYESVNHEGGVNYWLFYDKECDNCWCGCGPCNSVFTAPSPNGPYAFYENTYREIPH